MSVRESDIANPSDAIIGPQIWGVLHRIQQDEREHLILRLRIRDVPPGVTNGDLRVALERAGRVFAEGSFLWGNHYITSQAECPDMAHAAGETISYADLLDEAQGEKRITLRVPIGLHAAIVRAARGGSVNQFCIDILAATVGYQEGDPLPEPLADGVPVLPEFVRQVFLDIRH